MTVRSIMNMTPSGMMGGGNLLGQRLRSEAILQMNSVDFYWSCKNLDIPVGCLPNLLMRFQFTRDDDLKVIWPIQLWMKVGLGFLCITYSRVWSNN